MFKIKTEGTLGDRNELDLAHELFINEYAKIEQVAFNKFIDKMFKLKTGLDITFEVEQVQPIGKELPLENQNVINALNARDPNIVTNYIIEKYGLKIEAAEIGVPTATVIQEEVQVNEHLKNLTGRQRQNLFNIANKLKKGDYTADQALIMIKTGFGLSDADALTFLGIAQDEINNEVVKVQQSNERANLFLEWVRKNKIPINNEDETIDVEYVNFKNSTEVLKFELSKQKLYTTNRLQLSVTDLRNAILNQFKGNPFAKPEELAKALNVDIEKINTQINWLEKKKLGSFLDGIFTPTDKGLDKDTEDYETEIYTVYRYVERPDAPEVKTESRKFCIDMVALTESDALTYEQIETYTNEFGEDAWNYRGGFYTNPNTGETTPWCRHIWVGETKVKRNKK